MSEEGKWAEAEGKAMASTSSVKQEALAAPPARISRLKGLDGCKRDLSDQ